MLSVTRVHIWPDIFCLAAGPVESVTNFVIQSFKLPTAFPPEVLQLTEGMTVPPLGNRVDVRSVPLVTIDGVDSRDFDDAVWAETDGDPENPGVSACTFLGPRLPVPLHHCL